MPKRKERAIEEEAMHRDHVSLLDSQGATIVSVKEVHSQDLSVVEGGVKEARGRWKRRARATGNHSPVLVVSSSKCSIVHVESKLKMLGLGRKERKWRVENGVTDSLVLAEIASQPR